MTATRVVGALALLFAVSGARADPQGLTSARVLITADGDEQGWLDYLVEGQGPASLERCQRLVRDSLRENVAGPHIARRVERDCDVTPLPTRPAEQEARILRRDATIPLLDLSAVGLPGSRGRLISSLLTPSEAACAEMRDQAPAEGRPRRWLDENQRRAADEVCANAAAVERRVGGGGMWKKVPKAKRVQLRMGREACARARDRDKFEGKRAATGEAEGPRCVRE